MPQTGDIGTYIPYLILTIAGYTAYNTKKVYKVNKENKKLLESLNKKD